MDTSLTIFMLTITMSASVAYGIILWNKRNEVHDRSRTYLSLSFFIFASMTASFLILLVSGKTPFIHTMLHPLISIGGLFSISVTLYYPIEMMRPNWLKGWRLLIPLSPALLITAPILFGIQFQDIRTFIDLKERWMEFDVLLRIISIAFLGIIALLILIIPYNWRKSSADGQILRHFVILSEMTSVLFYCDCFAGNQMMANLNFLWGVFYISYISYYELKLKIIPPIETQDLPDEPEPIQQDNTQDDLWQRISRQMEKNEMWRNPDASVEMMSRAVGTNRIYVADCIREHTGLTFNDFLNKWRTEYMAGKLRLDPTQDHKPLYFEIGYRNRQTAYRNFIKFIGCSPSDFVASL